MTYLHSFRIISHILYSHFLHKMPPKISKLTILSDNAHWLLCKQKKKMVKKLILGFRRMFRFHVKCIFRWILNSNVNVKLKTTLNVCNLIENHLHLTYFVRLALNCIILNRNANGTPEAKTIINRSPHKRSYTHSSFFIEWNKKLLFIQIIC